MRVVHFGTADNKGGAARAAFQLHQGLIDAGHRSYMLVNQQYEERPEIGRIGFTRSLTGRILNRALLEGERLTGMQNLLQPRRRTFTHHPFVVGTDVIHLHNLHGNFFPHTILPKLSTIAPLVWTLHDSWALTGHCAYTYDCERWRTGCGACPRLAEYPPISIDTTAFLWRLKRQIYREADLTVVAPSQWLMRMARASPLFAEHEVHCIPYSVDTHLFQPRDQADARRELGIAPEARVLMAIVAPGGERKGPQYLPEVIERMTTRPVTLLTVGGGELAGSMACSVRDVGEVRSQRMMNVCYAAADVFVLPTLADNLPVAVLESFACGTPVAAFNVGGVPDLVVTGLTGYLSRYADPADLAWGLDDLLSDPARLTSMRHTARARAVNEYSGEIQARRYLDLYEKVRERRVRRSSGGE